MTGLDRIEHTSDGGLRIGALARLNDTAQHELVLRYYPVLSQAILKRRISATAQPRHDRRQPAAEDSLSLFPGRAQAGLQQA